MAVTSSSLVLVLNCGSSSIKFAVINHIARSILCNGIVQRIGTKEADLQIQFLNNAKGNKSEQKQKQNLPNIDYRTALQTIIKTIQEQNVELYNKIFAIGHRVVHGGEAFTASTIINDKVLETIKECANLAPLHNPANIIGIEEASKAFSHLPQVAVFDTAFHQTLLPYAFVYPIPYEYYQKYRIRRYGFHGTSHRFVSKEAALKLNKDYNSCALITAHLGNGCSAAAILNGSSIDTTMGFTPLEGLMMGTRSGDIDPGIFDYLASHLAVDETNGKVYDVHKITEILNRKSGLLGVSGSYADMRAIEEEVQKGDQRAILALEIFCYRLAKYIGALAVPLGRLDALVFTGGIGENSCVVREKTVAWLKIFGFKINKKRNAEHGENTNGIITRDEGPVAMVVHTNEELLISQETAELVGGGGGCKYDGML